jgi:MoCo/4Fe-4S cofactor protein with predicted Tat translocation signal
MRDPIDLAALRARLAEESGPRLWRSLEELADDAAMRRYLEAEFPDVMQAGSIDRRTLLKLTAASLALAGLSACNPGQGQSNAPLVSQARGTPGYTPGVPAVFATSLELGGYGRGVLVKAQEGRPIKIEGNPLHPASLGATDVFAQAEILTLYDPDRSRAVLENGEAKRFDALFGSLAQMREAVTAVRGRGLHILMEPVASPTVERLMREARAALPEARWHFYSPVGDENRRAGAVAAFGRAVEPVYDPRNADVIVTFGGDLFAFEPGHLRYAAEYQARRRDPDRPLPRLFAVETSPSLVGARADHRLALKPSEVEAFVRALAAAFGIGEMPQPHPRAGPIAAALLAAGARGLVVAGREQPPVVHALAHALNQRLGAVGTTVRYIEPVQRMGEGQTIQELAQAVEREAVTHLLVLGGNPAYDAPADLGFSTLLGRVPNALHLGFHRNETAVLCRWHVPLLHALESWGDLRAFDGTAGIRQPATVPLGPGLSLEEMLAGFAGLDGDGQSFVRATWREAWSDLSADAFEARWREVLEAGVVPETAAPAVDVGAATYAPDPPPTPTQGPEVLFSPDPSLWDGRYANNGWLQELPKPLSKQVWGNAALIAPETAQELGLTTGSLVEVGVGARSLKVPVWVLPGHAAGAVTLPLGYGRTHAGELGSGIGFDAYVLRSREHFWSAPARIARAEGEADLITTQHHHAMEGRDIVRVVTAEDPSTPGPRTHPSLYPEWVYDGHAWGMAIDLDACIGCNACVIACQSENNVPVVGPEQVEKGREMHWLRIDRYYGGDPGAPDTYFQPVLCMHCEKAPCEVVCPVNATVHSDEGLNDMVYNRCIGTRTCSNNCPYKVRRFNFLDYTAADFDWANPAVTVRDRGVMEKCTYCVHRISAGRIAARLEDRPLEDGEVVTACQQACPTQAIVFGDQNDPNTAVSRLKATGRNYALLGELNTQPRTTYLARIAATDPLAEGG